MQCNVIQPRGLFPQVPLRSAARIQMKAKSSLLFLALALLLAALDWGLDWGLTGGIYDDGVLVG